MKKVMIVGGAGYIGSLNVKVFLDRGYDVFVVDNLNTGHKEAIDPRARFYQVDIRDKVHLKEVVKKEKPDAVIHFAALSLVGVSCKEPLEYFSNNVYGMQILLEVMKEENIRFIVFSSSAATYGDQKDMPLTEESKTEPTNPYGETKLMMEKMMKWCDKAYGIKYVSLRYFNAAGALLDGTLGEDHHPETHLIPLILQVPLNKREQIHVFGNDYDTKDGTCIRDYIHVLDLADAHVKALEYLLKEEQSQIFNLGNGLGYSVDEMIKEAEVVVGKPIKKEYAPRREGDPAILIASNEKAKKILKWNPKYTLNDIMESAWKFHSTHIDGYKKK